MIDYLRIKTVNGLLRLVAWLMGLPSPSGGGGTAPQIESQPTDQKDIGGNRYFVGYTFSCAWPHHNSPVRVPGGFGDCVITVKPPMDLERVNSIRHYLTANLSKTGMRNPCVTMLSVNRIGWLTWSKRL